MSAALLKKLQDIEAKQDKILAHFSEADDLITEAEAGKFLGLAAQTMRDYVCNGKLAGTFTINAIGKRMYYKSKLISCKS